LPCSSSTRGECRTGAGSPTPSRWSCRNWLANAVLHGLVPGRDFELRLVVLAGTLRVEASDARGELGPELRPFHPGAESGFGLHLVGALATSWGVKDRAVGKTVWAELAMTP
jgi:hypothetical protein